MTPRAFIHRLLFGPHLWPEDQEYRAFQYRFLVALVLVGAACTMALVIPAWAGWNPIPEAHVRNMTLFSLASVVVWQLLRCWPRHQRLLGLGYELICLAEYTSALVYVPGDEFRVFWFFVNIPGTYIILGPRWGLAIALGTTTFLWGINPALSAPYSVNALATMTVGSAYLAVFFHVYGARSISYFVRMRELHDRLQTLATRDGLTGVYNARAFHEVCTPLLQAARRQGQPCALLFIDLDHFKRINDTLGHATGDEVLRAVAHALGQDLRRSDVLGRVGGEEFAAFLPNTDEAGAVRVAEGLRRAIEALRLTAQGQAVPVTASLGVAARPAQASDAWGLDEIRQRADEAMYQAKAAGRNRVSTLQLEAAAEGSPGLAA